MKYAPCVRSGFCCKSRPCGYGKWNSDRTACAHLAGTGPGKYACGIHDEIVGQPGSDLSPAFGAGCCSTLFNIDRERVIRGES